MVNFKKITSLFKFQQKLPISEQIKQKKGFNLSKFAQIKVSLSKGETVKQLAKQVRASLYQGMKAFAKKIATKEPVVSSDKFSTKPPPLLRNMNRATLDVPARKRAAAFTQQLASPTTEPAENEYELMPDDTSREMENKADSVLPASEEDPYLMPEGLERASEQTAPQSSAEEAQTTNVYDEIPADPDYANISEMTKDEPNTKQTTSEEATYENLSDFTKPKVASKTSPRYPGKLNREPKLSDFVPPPPPKMRPKSDLKQKLAEIDRASQRQTVVKNEPKVKVYEDIQLPVSTRKPRQPLNKRVSTFFTPASSLKKKE